MSPSYIGRDCFSERHVVGEGPGNLFLATDFLPERLTGGKSARLEGTGILGLEEDEEGIQESETRKGSGRVSFVLLQRLLRVIDRLMLRLATKVLQLTKIPADSANWESGRGNSARRRDFGQEATQKAPRVGCLSPRHLFWSAGHHDLATRVAPLGAEVYDVIGGVDYV